MNKKNFWTFVFSIIPGCGLMYLGYMKKGLQAMATFAAAALIGGFFMNNSINWFGGFFLILLPIIWFYQMFDSMHTVARMKNQGIELPSDDGFLLPENIARFSPTQNRTVAKIVAYILLGVGGISLISGVLSGLWRFPMFDQEILNNINMVIRYNLIPGIVSIVLIIIGIRLLRGGKSKKNNSDKGGE